jgi:hypothetical protein
MWKTGVMSLTTIIGVVSTKTEIWFFEKGVKISILKFQKKKIKLKIKIEIES